MRRRACRANACAEFYSRVTVKQEVVRHLLFATALLPGHPQNRNIRSSTIFAVFNQFCYVPKHTTGEQLLQVREAKREQAAYESTTSFESRDP